jgi:hypothetical protein
MNSGSFKSMLAFAALLAALAAGVWIGTNVMADRDARPPSAAASPEKTAQVVAPAPPAARPDPVPEPAPAPKAQVQDVAAAPLPVLPEIRALIAAGKLLEAREAILKLYWDEHAGPALRTEIEAEMAKLSEYLYFKKPTDREFESYTVQPGDSLISIARRFRTEKKINVEHGQIRLMSGMSRDLLHVGMTLRIPRGRFSVVVRKSTFKLHLMHEGLVVRTFRCGLGKNDATPAARFTIGTKTASPTWFPPESTGLKGPIPPGDPRNLLGSHWIALDSEVHRGLGIHGTAEPDSIGTNSSLGCVRLSNDDVRQLFDMVGSGMEVQILD